MNGGVFAAVFVAMFAAHHLGDHILQTDLDAANKANPGIDGAAAMLLHLLSYHAAMTLALLAIGLAGVELTVPGVVAGLAFSMVTHGFIDRRWPVRWLLRNTGSPRFAEPTSPLPGMYLADQSLHVACLFVAALLVAVIR